MTLATTISQLYDEDFSFLEGINNINEFTIKSQPSPIAMKFEHILKLLNFAGIKYETSVKINNNSRIFPIYLPEYRLIFDTKESYIKGTFQEISGNLRRQIKIRITLVGTKRAGMLKQAIQNIKYMGQKKGLNKLITNEHNRKMYEFRTSPNFHEKQKSPQKPIGTGVLPGLKSKVTLKLANRKMIDHIYFLKEKRFVNPLLPDKLPRNITRTEAWQIIQTAEKQLLKSKKIQKSEMYVGG